MNKQMLLHSCAGCNTNPTLQCLVPTLMPLKLHLPNLGPTPLLPLLPHLSSPACGYLLQAGQCSKLRFAWPFASSSQSRWIRQQCLIAWQLRQITWPRVIRIPTDSQELAPNSSSSPNLPKFPGKIPIHQYNYVHDGGLQFPVPVTLKSTISPGGPLDSPHHLAPSFVTDIRNRRPSQMSRP